MKRVLGEDTSEDKKTASCALHQLLKIFLVGDVITGKTQCCFAVLALVNSLNSMDFDGTDVADALGVVSLLAEMKQSVNFTFSPWSARAENPSSLKPLECCLAERPHLVQVEVIEILSRIYGDQLVVLGDLLVV